MGDLFSQEVLQETWDIVVNDMPLALWETFYVTVLATLFAVVIGLPLGVLLVVGEKDGILPLPKPLMGFLNVLINVLRSVPFLILMILVFPLTRLIVGTIVGTTASVVPLVIAAFPFVARLVESSLREVNPGKSQHDRSRAEHGCVAFSDYCQGHDTRKRAVADFKRYNSRHNCTRLHGNERYNRRRRFGKNRN